MLTIYDYSVSTDFPNGIIAGQLFVEIHENTTITAVINNVLITEDNVQIIFETALTTEEKTELDTLVILHKPLSSVETFKIQEETVETGGHFKLATKVLNISASTTEEVDYIWPIPISILAVYYVSQAVHEGDGLEMIISPNKTIGTITQPVVATDTVITVSDTVIGNACLGFYLKLSDGSNTDDLDRVVAVDKINKTVTVETAAVNAFAAGASVIQNIYMAGGPAGSTETYEIGPAWARMIGESKIGGTHVPANTTLRVRYIENKATSKKIVFKIEYLY